MPAPSVTVAPRVNRVAARARLIFLAATALECPRGFSWPPGAVPEKSCQGNPRRARLRSQTPASQVSAIRRAAGSTRPSGCDEGNCAPITVIARTTITSRPSSTSRSDAARVVSADFGPMATSSITRTTVWIAIPPRMLPIAIPRSCASAAEAVIAISGRFVATASRIAPPRASPSPSRMSSASVELESRIPADPDGRSRREEDQDERGETEAREHAAVCIGSGALLPESSSSSPGRRATG